MNRFPNLWEVAPGLAQIEQNVIRWLCDLFGYPEEARGILTTGGSIANLSAVVTARHAKLGEDFADGTYYVSEQAHASVPKAAAIAGLPRRAMRLVPVDAELRMDAEALKSMVAEDRAAGPPAVPRRPGRGHHQHRRDRSDGRGGRRRRGRGPVDARRRRLRRLLPAHRSGAGAVPRDRARGLDHARPAQGDVPARTGPAPWWSATAPRCATRTTWARSTSRTARPRRSCPNWNEYSPELSRDHRGFRVWLPLVLHGVGAFRQALDEKLDLAEHLYAALAEIPEIELPWPPQLSVVPFRLAGASDDEDRAFLTRINDPKRVYLSSTTIDGRHIIRACIVSHRTHRDRIDEAIEIIRTAAKA